MGTFARERLDFNCTATTVGVNLQVLLNVWRVCESKCYILCSSWNEGMRIEFELAVE
jgi:hypothetical protein